MRHDHMLAVCGYGRSCTKRS